MYVHIGAVSSLNALSSSISARFTITDRHMFYTITDRHLFYTITDRYLFYTITDRHIFLQDHCSHQQACYVLVRSDLQLNTPTWASSNKWLQAHKRAVLGVKRRCREQ